MFSAVVNGYTGYRYLRSELQEDKPSQVEDNQIRDSFKSGYIGLGIRGTPLNQFHNNEKESIISEYLALGVRGIPLQQAEEQQDQNEGYLSSGYQGFGIRGTPLTQADEPRTSFDAYMGSRYFGLRGEREEKMQDKDESYDEYRLHDYTADTFKDIHDAEFEPRYLGLGVRGAPILQPEQRQENSRTRNLLIRFLSFVGAFDALEDQNDEEVPVYPSFIIKPLIRGKKASPDSNQQSNEDSLNDMDEKKRLMNDMHSWDRNLFLTMVRGEKDTAPTWIKQLLKRNAERARDAETPRRNTVLPWEMNYFSPMLRGKKSMVSPTGLKLMVSPTGLKPMVSLTGLKPMNKRDAENVSDDGTLSKNVV